MQTAHLIHYILCCCGIAVSLYTIQVEWLLLNIPGYEPSCNISALSMSCSRVFTSKYARPLSNWNIVSRGSLWDLSLPQLALLYFVPLLLLPALSATSKWTVRVYRLLSYTSVAFNIYLAYILKFVLGELCIVCVSNYIVNLGLVLTVDRIARRSDVTTVKEEYKKIR
jgi:uncharacterized membrane protein